MGPGYSAGWRSNESKWIQTVSNQSNLFKRHSIQTGPSSACNIEIKYGFEGFDVRNNFTYRNILRFELDFELKFRETFVS
jgi:hypothetical protein